LPENTSRGRLKILSIARSPLNKHLEQALQKRKKYVHRIANEKGDGEGRNIDALGGIVKLSDHQSADAGNQQPGAFIATDV
jgi:hypothetical protein